MYKCKRCGNQKKFGKMFWIRENIVYEDGMEFSMMAEKKIAEIYCVDCGASSEDGLILDHKDKVIKLL